MIKRTKKALVIVACGVLLNIALALTKLFVGLKTNSLCILLDATNGFIDTFTSVVAVIAFALSAKPRSERYPYGNGRAEYVAGFIVSAAATVMGGIFLLDSLKRISLPEPVWFGWESFVLVSVGIAVKLGMAIGYELFNKSIKSSTFRALAADSFLDIGITAATLISFTLSSRLNYAVDSIFGIVMSVIIIITSVKMIRDNLGVLSGSKSCAAERETVINACKESVLIKEIVKIRLHDYGYRACYGTVFVAGEDGKSREELISECDRLRAFLKEETGAEIDFVLAEKSAENS